MPFFPVELNVSFEAFEKEAFAFSIDAAHSHMTSPATCHIKASADTVMKAFVDYIWKRGGGMGQPVELRGGKKPNGEGNIRTPGYGLFELILQVDDTKKMLEYTIPRGLPISSHQASVYFEPLQDGTTRVAWIVRYTPKWYGLWFGLYCEKVLFPFFLKNLKLDVEIPNSS